MSRHRCLASSSYVVVSRKLLVVAMTAAAAAAQATLTVDRLDAGEVGGPAPASLVVVDVYADVATSDAWVAAGLRATSANGATLRYGAGNVLVNPGLADRFVTCLSRPLARNADARFNAPLALASGRYDPSGPIVTATAAEANVAWFSSPPVSSTSPSVDGYIARVVIDIAGVVGIDPATIVVAPGLPPVGSVPLLVSQPAPTSSAPAGTVAATFDVPAIAGLDWCVYASAVPAVVLSVDRLDAGEIGGPAPANLVVVDVFADIGPTDTWIAAGLRATTANGAVLRYGVGNALVNPGLADRFVTCLSRPLARNADARFNAPQALTAGRYDPSGPTATSTAAEANVAWFSSPPATPTSPSVDGYIARIVIDITGVVGIDPATIVVAPGLPPPGSVPLLVSQPAPASLASAGTVAATFDAQTPVGIDWCVYGASCAAYVGTADPTTGVCNQLPFGAPAATSLTTLFAQNAGGVVGGTIYLDVTTTNGLFVNGLSLNTSTPVGTPMTVQVWRTAAGATHVGNENNLAAWIPETMGFGAAAAVDTPSSIELNSPFRLAPGTYGLAIVAYGFRHSYTIGANAYADANLSISTGSATSVPFTAPVFTPRTANLSLRYHLEANLYGNQRYQTIVRANQLSAGPITGLAVVACATGRHWNESLLVRMSHVPAGHVLSTTFATNLPTPVTVLDAADFRWHVAGNAWNEIGLQNTFAYDGVRDLVIDIVARGNFHTAGAAFRRDSAVPRVAAFGWSGAPPATATGGNSAFDNLGMKLRLQRGCASAAEYGWSCGRARAGHSGLPVLGQTFAFTVTEAPPNLPAFLNLGLATGAPLFPFGLAPFGLRNCELFHDVITTVGAPADGAGNGAYSYNFPFSPAAVGFRFYGQWLTLDASAPDGLGLSNYVRMLCGL